MDLSALVLWFQENKRDLPWRKNRTFYRVWISEVMLQQTQVDTVIPYYENFMTVFPDINSLAESNIDKVLKNWEGLGYYSRARNLHKAAQAFNTLSSTPETYEELIKYSGFGPYTTAAVLSLVLKKEHPVIDGNVKRVISRLYFINENIESNSVLKRIQLILEKEIKKHPADDFNESLMELGALICKPKNPLCKKCPLEKICISKIKGKEQDLPIKKVKKKIPTKYEKAIIALFENKLLIAKRDLNEMLGGLWKIPNQLDQDSNKKLEKFAKIKHQYSHFKLELECFVFTFTSNPKLKANEIMLDINEIENYAFDKASLKVIEKFRDFNENSISH